ncbi:hypothetical protein [Actinoplanes sp. M2I2]|uniref:hypothetical protein n=1 Tax=Actinoplanes sp. M2I2 TaxID=1734444 RepID=UPI002020919B|nr:hypothetical protein [Actinoplanes sp. M2I2]
MRPSARRLATFVPITVAGVLLYLLVPLAATGKVTGPVVLGRPVVWLSLQLLSWATLAATLAVVLLERRRHSADQIRLADEAERVDRSIRDCAVTFDRYRAILEAGKNHDRSDR